MARIKVPQTLSQTKTLEELRKYASQTFDQLIPMVNGNISLIDNMSVKVISVTFPGSGIEVGVDHGLARVPNGFFQKGADAPIIVYDGPSDNTQKTIYLQSSGSGTASIVVF